MIRQRTLRQPALCTGIGIHRGTLTEVTLLPAPENHGIIFYRADLPGKPAVPADVDLVVDVSRGTTLAANGVKVHTVEHLMAALHGLGIDNVRIELNGDELPNDDGSAKQFVEKILAAGIEEQNARKNFITIDKPVFYSDEQTTLSIFPSDEFRISLTIVYDHVAIGTQYRSSVITPEVFANEIAPARTFCFLREVRPLKEQGLIRGGSIENAVVIGDEAILNESLRFPDEFVRHKMLDLLGDIYLLGKPLRGHIIAVRCGHAKNILFAKQIRMVYPPLNGKYRLGDTQRGQSRQQPALDVKHILKILPHRYPFLLVDRILSFVPFERAVGIKNVTMNEPFFQGHWPDKPIMPAVLIVETMAQVSSVIIFGQDNDYRGKLAYFTGIERARFRREVVPGDQLVIVAELVHMRNNTFRVRAIARVEQQTVAEAIMSFTVVDKVAGPAQVERIDSAVPFDPAQ